MHRPPTALIGRLLLAALPDALQPIRRQPLALVHAVELGDHCALVATPSSR